MLIIGGGFSTSGERYFRGYIDNFAIFNRALTDIEIGNLYDKKGYCKSEFQLKKKLISFIKKFQF